MILLHTSLYGVLINLVFMVFQVVWNLKFDAHKSSKSYFLYRFYCIDLIIKKYLQEIHVSMSYQHWGLSISSGYESITGLQGNLSKSIVDGMMRNFSKKQEELSMLNWCIWFITNGYQFWLVQHSWRSLVLKPWQAALVMSTGKQDWNIFQPIRQLE